MTVTGARSPGITYQDLLDRDAVTHEVPAVLRLDSPADYGSVDIPVERYVSQDFFELEVEKVWKKAWQFACREEEIPNVGDTTVYEIVGYSFLIVRSAPDEIRAYYNACLHRGRLLRESPGHAGPVIRCPFHGFAWNHDGSLADVPASWDFPHVDPEKWHLPEVRVGRWGGFVFINMDQDAESFEDYLGDLPAHFARWKLEDRYVHAHVAKILQCNWKVAQEAFMEAFHVVATHPQILAGIADANSQYDVFGNFSRAVTPNGTPSPHITWEPSEQEMLDAMTDRRIGEEPVVVIPEGVTARQVAAEGMRKAWHEALPDVEDWCDSELADSIYYTLFPNFHPWGGLNRIVYRFRPYGSNVDMAIMECLYLEPFEGERPPAAKVQWLGPDDDWTLAPQLENLTRVFNQDTFNLPKVQLGLKFTAKPGVTLANYQETKIRHFHVLLERFLAR